VPDIGGTTGVEAEVETVMGIDSEDDEEEDDDDGGGGTCVESLELSGETETESEVERGMVSPGPRRRLLLSC
jgi:hypothetical protein